MKSLLKTLAFVAIALSITAVEARPEKYAGEDNNRIFNAHLKDLKAEIHRINTHLGKEKVTDRVIKHDNGDFYLGGVTTSKDGVVAHGEGMLTSKKTGGMYSGDFMWGSKQGWGIEERSDGTNKYRGEFQYGIRSGYGEYTFTNGSKYVGDFAHGKQHGYGTKIQADGNVVYQGFWTNGKTDPELKRRDVRTIEYTTGTYIGEFTTEKDGTVVAHGKGTFESNTNGVVKVYRGTFKNGKQHGYSIVTTTEVPAMRLILQYIDGKSQPLMKLIP